MKHILRPLTILALLAALALTAAACGGDDEAATQDPGTLLTETFSGEKDIKSGKLQLSAKINISGAGGGPVDVKLSGPFESQGDDLPKLDLDLSFSGGGQSFAAGLTSTGEKAFVNFQGTDYAVSDELFKQVKDAYAQAQKQSGEQEDVSLQTLGLDPRSWLTGAKNEGESKVGDTDTIKITGGVDVPKLLEDLNKALSKAGQLGLQGQAQIPTELSQEQRDQISEVVKDVRVEIHTGADDKILRRMLITLKLDAGDGGSGDVAIDFSLLDLNEGQDISEPENAKPFDELLGQLGGLGALLGGGVPGGGAGGAGGAGGGGGGAGAIEPDAETQKQFEAFTKCLEEAGADQAAAQKCSELITP